MRAFVWLGLVVSSISYAQPSQPAPEELRHELFDRVVIVDARREWGAGAITVEHAPSEQDTRLVMTRAIDSRRVPAALLAWRGRKLVAGRDGSTCATEVAALHLLAVTEPASELGFWNGAIDPLPARGVALSTWNDSHVWLVGELSGACLGRTWLRAADLAIPATAAPTVVPGPLRDRVLAAFRALPAYRAIQVKFHGTGEWETGEDGADPVLRFDLANRTLLAHAASAHVGSTDERLLVVWELRDGPQPELKFRHVATTAALPRAPFGLSFAMDLRGDGHVLFVYTTRDSRGALYEVGDKLVDVSSLRLATK